jgi:hypothetical protein
MDEDADFRIEQFELNRDNTPEILEVIRQAYINNSPTQGGTIAFDQISFNMMFGSPFLPKNFVVRAIDKHTGKIVGFLGGIPRFFYCNGKVYKTGIPTMLGVLPEYRQHHLAFRMSLELLEIGNRLDYDGGFAFYEPEEHGIDTGKAISRTKGLELRVLFNIRKFLIRVINVKKVSLVVKLKWYERLGLTLLQPIPKKKDPQIRIYKSSDGEQLFKLLDDFKERNQCAFIRDRDDFLWYLDQPGVNCVVHENTKGNIDGFLVAWRFLLAGFGNNVPFGWMDLVHIHRLSIDDAKNLAHYFALTAKEQGWMGMQMPCLPYFDPRIFQKAKYAFFAKKLLFVVFPRKPIDLPPKIETFYFDWR